MSELDEDEYFDIFPNNQSRANRTSGGGKREERRGRSLK
jgi:hypothetical protein